MVVAGAHSNKFLVCYTRKYSSEEEATQITNYGEESSKK